MTGRNWCVKVNCGVCESAALSFPARSSKAEGVDGCGEWREWEDVVCTQAYSSLCSLLHNLQL